MIDLDLPAPASAGDRRSLPGGLSHARPATAVALLLAVLLTLGAGASAPPNLTEVVAVGQAAASTFALGPTALFAAAFGSDAQYPAEVRRYSLADGSVQWTARLPQNARNLTIEDSGHVLMATSNRGPEIAFLDADTGRALWRSTTANTSPLGTTDHQVLLITSDLDARREDLLRLADLRTGRTEWARRVPFGAQLDAGDPALGPLSRLLVVGSDGHATVLDVADGTEIATADLGVRLRLYSNDGHSDYAEVTRAGDRLYVSRRVRGTTSLSAYAMDGLRPLWRVAGVPVGQVSDCDGFICVTDGQALTVLDEHDGSTRWTDPRWRFGTVDPVPGNQRHRILALDQRDDRAAVLLDAPTGRIVETLGYTVSVGRLRLRSDTRKPGHVWVSAPDAGGGFHTVGSLDTALPYGCAAAGTHLACYTSGGEATVWRVPA